MGALADAGVEPSRLCLEVTETTMLDRVARGPVGRRSCASPGSPTAG